MSVGGAGGSGAGGHGVHSGDMRGQGGWNPDGPQRPYEGESRAKYDAATERESAGLAKPGLPERFKRWFSAQF